MPGQLNAKAAIKGWFKFKRKAKPTYEEVTYGEFEIYNDLDDAGIQTATAAPGPPEPPPLRRHTSYIGDQNDTPLYQNLEDVLNDRPPPRPPTGSIFRVPAKKRPVPTPRKCPPSRAETSDSVSLQSAGQYDMLMIEDDTLSQSNIETRSEPAETAEAAGTDPTSFRGDSLDYLYDDTENIARMPSQSSLPYLKLAKHPASSQNVYQSKMKQLDTSLMLSLRSTEGKIILLT